MSYYLVHTTYLILFVAVFARQLCIPVPAILFLVSAGALSGTHKLSYPGILVVSVFGCVIADFIWFEAGRLRGKRILRLLCSLAGDPSYCIRRARTAFSSKGIRLLWVAKFVPGLDGICPPLAGMSGAKRRVFVLHDAIGATLWCGTYVTAGFVFTNEVNRVAHYASVFAIGLILVLGVPLLAFAISKSICLVRAARLNRARQISPEQLRARIELGKDIGIVDLLRFEEDPGEEAVIPGAVRIDPLELRRKRRITMPVDLDLVLYCRSTNSFVSARAAAEMRKHGIDRIYILQGGLAAWKAAGYSTDHVPLNPAEVSERLAIVVYPPWNSHVGTRPFRRRTPAQNRTLSAESNNERPITRA